MVLERRLILKAFDACVGPQQFYRCAGLNEIVVLLDTIPVPVRVGIINQPFRANIIAVETNTAVGD